MISFYAQARYNPAPQKQALKIQPIHMMVSPILAPCWAARSHSSKKLTPLPAFLWHVGK